MTHEPLLQKLMLRVSAPIGSDVDDRGHEPLPPQSVSTPHSALHALYKRVPGRLPHLFEALLCAYRWPEADLGLFLLFANPPGVDFQGFANKVLLDRGLADSLLPARLVQFGRAPGGSYDPVCFDLRRSRRGDCPIVQVDHEEILCNYRVKVVAQLADTFAELATKVATPPDAPHHP